MSVSLHSNTTRLPDTILGAISLAASSGIENISALFTSRPEQLPQRSAASFSSSPTMFSANSPVDCISFPLAPFFPSQTPIIGGLLDRKVHHDTAMRFVLPSSLRLDSSANGDGAVSRCACAAVIFSTVIFLYFFAM